MTAPICHGAAGGCIFGNHSDDCPVTLVRLENFIAPAKRAVGQCNCLGGELSPPSHQPDCPALSPLQPQPGDTRDALTRLVAFLRHLVDDGTMGHAEMHGALDLISETRDTLSAASTWKGAQIDTLRAELSKVKADLLTTQRSMGEAIRTARYEVAAAALEDCLTEPERIAWLKDVGAANAPKD